MRNMRRVLSLPIFLSLCACTVAAHGNMAKRQHQNQQYTFTSYKLANGLRVVLSPDETQTGVAVNISFDAGSRVESLEQAGVAILLQRIMLQNLRGFLHSERGETLKPFEGAVNQERASYFTELTAGQFDFVLSSLAQQMHTPYITQTFLDEQRVALLNECEQLDHSRFGRVQEVLLELIYKDSAHKYGSVCSPTHLNHLSLELAQEFLRTFYVPNNAVITIVGNFKKEDAKKSIAKQFGAMNRQKIASNTELSSQPLSLGRRPIIHSSRANAATYMSAYLTVPSNHPDWYAMNVLADIIGQGDTSRLYTALVAKNLAASVLEGVFESRGHSLFRIGVALLPDVRVETLETMIDVELARIQNDGVSQTEVEKARSQERAYYAEQLGTPLGRASFLARSTLYYNDPNRINTELDFILAVTAQEVQQVAKKYLVKTNRAVVIAQPAVSE